MSPLEAVANYGGSITFTELRALLQARCGPHCQAVIEPSIKKPDELVWKKHIP